MNRRSAIPFALALSSLLTSSTLPAQAAPTDQAIAGLWSGTATVSGEHVPVSLEISVSQLGKVQGTFLNGPERSASTSGGIAGANLSLTFSDYDRTLDGKITPDGFHGIFSGARVKTPIPVELHPEPAQPYPSAAITASTPANAKTNPKSIEGDWEIAVHSEKGESAWAMRVTPATGGTGIHPIKAVILRIDGDTGGLYGSYDAATASYRVGRFSSALPQFFSLQPQPDGTLRVTDLIHDEKPWTARRPAEARALNLAPPTKSTDQTGMLDPTAPLHYSGVTLAGQTVTDADPRFKGKVVIVAIGGSWCPNCHDEAPFLVDLYNRYHAKGLEIVDLSFEEGDELKDPVRLRAFVAKYKIPYPVLLAGTPDDLNARLPQAKNLNCWPTTFFIGRNGLVQQTHAGFSGPATGDAYVELKAETTALVEKLLAAKQVAQVP
jgi:thiol-disulfide isomerase/thioredoxin